jgi:hypothetical protein
LDPNGDDDYFNSEGRLIRKTNTGSKIYLQTAQGNVLLAQVPLSTAANRQAIANVVGHYAEKVGIIYQSKGSDVNKGDGIVGLGWGKSGSERNPGYTLDPSKDILINKNGNKINSNLSDYYNLESVFVHEQQHKKLIEKGVTQNLQTHTQIYLDQIEDATFAKTTEDFQKGIVGSFSNYLLNYYAREASGTTQLEKFASDFNQKNKAGYSIHVDVSSNDENDYKVDIYKKNKLVGSISYKKIEGEGSDD